MIRANEMRHLVIGGIYSNRTSVRELVVSEADAEAAVPLAIQ